MATAELHVGDAGVPFRATVVDDAGAAVDLSAATLLRLDFATPDGGVFSRTAALVTDGTDGKMQYVTADSDLTANGTWKVQGYVEAGGVKLHTAVLKFKVLANLSQ